MRQENPYYTPRSGPNPWTTLMESGGRMRQPPDPIPQLMVRFLTGVPLFRLLGDTIGTSSVQLILYELLGKEHHWKAVLALAFLLTCTQHGAITKVFMGFLSMILLFPLTTSFGGLLFVQAVHMAVNNNCPLILGDAPPFLQRYAHGEAFLFHRILVATVPYVSVGFLLPVVYPWITRLVPSWGWRVGLLLGPKIPFTIFVVVTRMRQILEFSQLAISIFLAVVLFPARLLLPPVTQRLIKLARVLVVLWLDTYDRICLWFVLQASKRGVKQHQEKHMRKKNQEILGQSDFEIPPQIRALNSQVYAPLEQGQFRLLEIEPREWSGKQPAVVRCKLRAVQVDQAKDSYEAISYRWPAGGQEQTEYPILIDGQCFMVAETVFRLLRGVQLQSSLRTIWIDSICINQDDATEVNDQISRMRDIYRGARGVVAWFGNSREGTGALPVLQDIATGKRSVGPEELEHTMYSAFPFEIYSWQKVIEFFRNEYFGRMWMVQEIALAKKITLKHGDEEMDWAVFSQLLPFFHSPEGSKFLHEPGWTKTQWWVDAGALSRVKNGLGMNVVRNLMSREQSTPEALARMPPQLRRNVLSMNGPLLQNDRLRKLPLEAVIGFMPDFEVTVPEDKIYGVGGLVSLPILPVVYGKTVEETGRIVRDAARSMLFSNDGGGTLQQFHLAGWGYHEFAAPIWSPKWLNSKTPRPEHLSKALPSWVPDWYQKRLNKPAIEGASYMAGTADPMVIKRIRPYIDHKPAHKPNLIRARVSRIGTVAVIGEPFLRLDPSDPSSLEKLAQGSQYANVIARFLEEAERMIRNLPDNGAMREAMWRALFGDTRANSLPPMEGEELKSLRSMVELLAGRQPTSSGAKGLEGNESSNAHAAFFDIGRSWPCHRFCVTVDGHVGLVPIGTIVGDSVFIVWGAPTPFVVRSRERHEEMINKKVDNEQEVAEGEYILVGSCYLHGFMMGEATTTQYPPEDIVLR